MLLVCESLSTGGMICCRHGTRNTNSKVVGVSVNASCACMCLFLCVPAHVSVCECM